MSFGGFNVCGLSKQMQSRPRNHRANCNYYVQIHQTQRNYWKYYRFLICLYFCCLFKIWVRIWPHVIQWYLCIVVHQTLQNYTISNCLFHGLRSAAHEHALQIAICIAIFNSKYGWISTFCIIIDNWRLKNESDFYHMDCLHKKNSSHWQKVERSIWKPEFRKHTHFTTEC